MKRILFLLLFIYFSILDISALSEYYFKQLSLKDGLSHPTVNAVLSDSNGWIWIGTRSGLNCFDKYQIRSYFNEINDSTSLYNNNISFINEDEQLNLWIGTGVLSVYNKKDDNFKVIKYNGSTINVISSCSVDDGVLFGGSNLYKYNYSTKSFSKLLNDKSLNDRIAFICRWNDGRIILGTKWDGLYVYDEHNGEIKKILPAYKHLSSCYVDKKGNLWISPYGKGLICYSSEGKILKEMTSLNSGLSHNTVLGLLERDNELWIATDGGGICIYNYETEKIRTLKHISGDMNSLPGNSVTCLYLDKNNYIWAGTVREGLLAIRNVSMRTYCGSPGSQYGLSENPVISLYEDHDGSIWIGTDGGGINKMSVENGSFRHYNCGNVDKITSITEYNADNLLVSAFDKGLFLFNKNTGVLENFKLADKYLNTELGLKGRNVYVYKYDKNKIYFFADSIYSYETTTGKFEKVKIGFDIRYYNIISSLIRFDGDNDNSFLFSQKDIYRLCHSENKLYSIYHLPLGVNANGVCRDSSGNLWIATNKGIACYDIKSSKMTFVDSNLFHEVTSITCDEENRIWFGSQGMLFTYMIDTKRFILWGESDGVIPNEYFSESIMKHSSGDIFIGGSSGLLRIKNKIDLSMDSYPEIYTAEIKIDGSPITDRNGEIPKEIKIPWNYNSMQIKIDDNDIDIFRKKVFRFIIKGNSVNSSLYLLDHTLSVHSLAPGEYVVLASCNMKDGSWSVPNEILKITITPPLWKNGWFLILILVLLIVVILFVSAYIIRKKERRMKWKMIKQEEQINKDKIRFLINVSHELRTPLTLIYAPLKRLLNTHDDKLDISVKSVLVGIYRQTMQMINILNMVLDARKMEVGQDKLNIQPHLLNDWILNIVDDFKVEYENKNIEIKYNFDESIKDVCFDEQKCRIVLSNILMNSLKFSIDNTCIYISTEYVENKDFIRVSVKDEGIGLGDMNIDSLFSRFVQGNHNLGGSGIGLSYSKTLIELHGGKIGAYNNSDGPGSTFYFDLPAYRDDVKLEYEKKDYINEMFSSEEKYPDTEPFNTSDYSVLVVEDEKDLRDFIVKILSESFREVYAAGDGVEALNIIKNKFPDIVVCDAMMPRMNGFELCNTVKSDLNINHIPVIMLTARFDEKSKMLGYKLGADAYLEKPFDVDMFMNILSNVLSNREKLKKKYKSFSNIKLTEMGNTNVGEEFLMKLDNVINEKLEDGNLDVSFIVDRLGVSRTALYNKVKQLAGMGVNEYIGKVRIEKAINLLKFSELSIFEISEKLGYKNQSYFSTAFKQSVGVSPSKYREDFRNKSE